MKKQLEYGTNIYMVSEEGPGQAKVYSANSMPRTMLTILFTSIHTFYNITNKATHKQIDLKKQRQSSLHVAFSAR